MENKILLETVRTDNELREFLQQNHIAFHLLIKKAVEMEFFTTLDSILSLYFSLYPLSFEQFMDGINYLDKYIPILIETNSLSNVLIVLLKLEFPCDFENYRLLQIISKYTIFQKIFPTKDTAILYFTKLKKYIFDMLLLLNIEVILSRLHNIPMNKGLFNFMNSCIQIKYNANYKEFVTKSFKYLFCGFPVKDINELKYDVICDDVMEFEFRDKDKWMLIFNHNIINNTEDILEFLLKYDIAFSCKDDMIKVLPHNHITFSSKIFDIVNQYQTPQINKIETVISNKNLDPICEDYENGQQTPIVSKKHNIQQFKNLYIKRKQFFKTHKLVKSDDEYQERKVNYESYLTKIKEKIECEKEKYINIVSTIANLETTLNAKIRLQKEKEYKAQLEQELLEKELQRKEEEKKQWSNKKNPFVPLKLEPREGFTKKKNENINPFVTTSLSSNTNPFINSEILKKSREMYNQMKELEKEQNKKLENKLRPIKQKRNEFINPFKK